MFSFKLHRWAKEAGTGVEVVFKTKRPKVQATVINETNPFWVAFHDTLVNELYVY